MNPVGRVPVISKTDEIAALSDRASVLAGLPPFEPRRGLRNGHLQTIIGNFLPRPTFPLLSVEETMRSGSSGWQPRTVPL